MIGAWRASGGARAGGWTRAATNHRRQASGNGFVRLLRANEMNMCVESTGRKNQPFASDDFSGDANDHPGGDASHHVRVARFANASNQSILNSDIRFDNAGVINNDRVRNNAIKRVTLTDSSGLAHAFAKNFAAPEFAFIAINSKILF